MLEKYLVALLVIFAVMIFAGCANPTATPGTSPGTVTVPALQGPAIYPDDQILGTWDWMSRGQTAGIQAAYTFTADGLFSRRDQHDSAIDSYSGTWSKADTAKYSLAYKGKNPGFDSENMYYMNQTGYLRNEVNDFFKKAT